MRKLHKDYLQGANVMLMEGLHIPCLAHDQGLLLAAALQALLHSSQLGLQAAAAAIAAITAILPRQADMQMLQCGAGNTRWVKG